MQAWARFRGLGIESWCGTGVEDLPLVVHRLLNLLHIHHRFGIKVRAEGRGVGFAGPVSKELPRDVQPCKPSSSTNTCCAPKITERPPTAWGRELIASIIENNGLLVIDAQFTCGGGKGFCRG